VIQPDARILDVVDQPPLAATRYLREPDGGAVINAKVKRGPDLERRIMWDIGYAAFALGSIEKLAIVAPRVWRVERAFQLLRELLIAHFFAQPGNSFVTKSVRLRIIQQIRRVAGRDPRSGIRRLQKSPAFRRAATHQRSVTVGEHRLNDERNHRLRRIIELIDDALVGIPPAPTVRIIRPSRLPRSAVR